MNIKTNAKSIGVLLLFQCLQLGICIPQGFFSGISPFSNRRTNDNSGKVPFNIRLKSAVSGFFDRQRAKQNQYQVQSPAQGGDYGHNLNAQSDYNQQNSYDPETNNGYREEVQPEKEDYQYRNEDQTKEEAVHQNKNEEQNKVEVYSRTGIFDEYKNEQSNIGQDYKQQPDPNYSTQIEKAKDPSNPAANEVNFDQTDSAYELETTTSTEDYETTTDDYGLDNRSGVNPNVVASLLG